MLITDAKILREIQREFNELFPHLKVEFYKAGHKVGEGSRPKQILDPGTTIGEIRKIHKEGDLKVIGEMKVSELEQAFEKNYGLHVQVFRRSGNIWLQTTKTDSWTLEAQNRKGGSSQKHFNKKYKPE